MRLRELASGLIFYGVLSTDPSVQLSAEKAAQDLSDLGLALPHAKVIRVWPLPSGGDALPATPSHAGTWRPGTIHIRPGNPTWLRHELMHEAMHHHCAGKLPRWALEAAAMTFSGEATSHEPASSSDLEQLRESTMHDGPLSRVDYETLRRLTSVRGWKPASPCEIPSGWRDLADNRGTGISWILRHVVSGRTIAKGGAPDAAEPPGSIMKLALFGAIKTDSPTLKAPNLSNIEESLMRSENLIQNGKIRAENIDWDMLSEFLNTDLRTVPLGARQTVLEDIAGYRTASGRFLISWNLEELSTALRLVILSDPQRFSFLQEQASSSFSTLAGAGSSVKGSMKKLRAGAKTGSVARADGTPLVGHVAYFWPVDRPQYMLVAKAHGIGGSVVARRSAGLLEQLTQILEPLTFVPRIQIMGRLARAQWRVTSPCGIVTWNSNEIMSRCGPLMVETKAPKAKPLRYWSGILETHDDRTVLETDPWTWAEDVVQAEGDGLPAEAKKALFAIALFNSKHGQHRHKDAICDLTHCMVGGGRTVAQQRVFDLQEIKEIAAGLRKLEGTSLLNRQVPWLEFSLGGDQPWSRQLKARAVAEKLRVSDLIEIQRVRGRSGVVSFQIDSISSVQTLSCEVFRSRLKLLSCPDQVRFDASSNTWTFTGQGEGHGRGLDLTLAARMAREGHSAQQILTNSLNQRASK